MSAALWISVAGALSPFCAQLLIRVPSILAVSAVSQPPIGQSYSLECPLRPALFGCPERQPFRGCGRRPIADSGSSTIFVLFAVFLSAQQKYEHWLEAQLDTWASVPYWEGRFVAVGDEHLRREPCVNFIRTNCSSRLQDYACKMSYIFLVADARGADWVVISQTDHYMLAPKWQQTVGQLTLETPYAFTLAFGCGVNVTTWRGCPAVQKFGGMCGASPHAMNKPAIQRIVAKGEMSLHREFKSYPPCPEDLAMTCVLRERRVPITFLNALQCANFGYKGAPPCGDRELVPPLSKDLTLAVHRVTRQRMFEVHALVHKYWRLRDTSLWKLGHFVTTGG